METTQKYYYHKIPKSSEIESTTTQVTQAPAKSPWFIGIIDSSGSMCSWWKFVAKNYNELVESLSTPQNKIITYCFDSSIHPVPENKLSDDIYKHGGSMTNIYAAMQRLDNELKKIPIDEEVRVCFVSDGEDTCNSNLMERLKTLRGRMGGKLTFMCVGVQSGFPTKVSMFLREKYHRGDSTVPSIFLIEYASDKAFFNKFQSLKPFISVKSLMKVDPPQRLFPWEAPVDEVPEDIWIMSQQETVQVNNGAFTMKYDDEKFSVRAVMEIFRSWSQKLQLDSLNKKINFKQAQEFACSCHGLMMNIIEDVKKSRGLDILTGKTSEEENFLARVLNLQISRTSSRIKGFLAAVDEIKDGKDLSQLNEYEAAKIIGLGTVVGKAQQRALALKNMGQDTLQGYIDEFVSVLQSIELKEENQPEESEISKTTFRRILGDNTLEAGLRQFHSPLDFLDIFPLFGIAVNIKRNDGSLDDAYKVSVKSFKNSIIDSSTFDFATHKLMLNGSEEFNGLCPLISKENAYLAPLFNTNLMRYIISYNTTEQLDKIIPNSWLVLLSDLFILSISNEDDSLLNRVLDTFSAMREFAPFNEIIEGIEANDSSVYKLLERRSTFLLSHYFVAKNSDFDEDEMEEIIQKMWIFYFQKRLTTSPIKDFVDSEESQGLKNAILEKYSDEYLLQKFFTRGEVARHINNKIMKEMNEVSGNLTAGTIKLVPGGFTADTNMPVSYKLMKALTKKLKGDSKLTDELTFQYLAHCVKYQATSVETPVDIPLEEAKIILSKDFQSTSSNQVKNRIKFQLLDELQKKYITAFKKAHWNTLPKKWEEVIESCKSRGIDWDKIEWKPQMGLAKNACMSDNCPHQFVPQATGRLRSHLGGWQGLLPRGFHSYVIERKEKTASEIYSGFMNNTYIKDISAYGVTEEQVLEYIENIKKVVE